MIIEIRVPDLGESISEVEIGEWLVHIGDMVHTDDSLVAIESEKATVELPSPREGVLVEIVKPQGQKAHSGDVIARIDTESGSAAAKPEKKAAETVEAPPPEEEEKATDLEAKVMPAAARILAQEKIAAEQVTPTGPGDRILKEDAIRAAAGLRPGAPARTEAQDIMPEPVPAAPPAAAEVSGEEPGRERRVPMSLLRRTIATRLLEAKRTMAILTTFNEADMSAVKQLRADLGPQFAEKYGVRLGFMSFFVRAVVAGLREFPLVNAMIDGNEIVYRDSIDVGVAIGGGKGLVVPVIRRAERLTFAEIERQIAALGEKAKNNTLTPEELRGGTFTISNGGVYGSMLSTPIVNPPQSAILGLHAIKDRPVAVAGQVVIRPVMYLALSYDHRIIDGREAVTFLKGIKERIEEPQKLLLEI
ncbi:MAG: dihydrolipoamide succinyltransferase [Desulfobacterales bacterium GWB2_56_26]|nr:MAG: dihydrolipoamide succinyltransferase [Desulfobacterales bacterium GWB2_56_26]